MTTVPHCRARMEYPQRVDPQAGWACGESGALYNESIEWCDALLLSPVRLFDDSCDFVFEIDGSNNSSSSGQIDVTDISLRARQNADRRLHGTASTRSTSTHGGATRHDHPLLGPYDFDKGAASGQQLDFDKGAASNQQPWHSSQPTHPKQI